MAASALSRPVRAVVSSAKTFNLPLRPSNQALQYLRSVNSPKPNPFASTPVRYASHAAQGRANGAKNGPGKRLGAKKTGEQFVVPGNIIYRQRGTLWFPGENCAMGRDHTIFATEKGYVKYYKDPAKHPKRQYIGVALERDQRLPTPLNAARRRRLNMVAVPIDSDVNNPLTDNYVAPPIPIKGAEDKMPKGMTLEKMEDGKIRPAFTLKDGTVLRMRNNYMFSQDDADFGKLAEKAALKVRTYRRGDRWLAWRKRTVKRAKAAEKRSLSKKGGGKAKAKARKAA